MNIHSSEGVVHRLQPRENAAVNEWWMCDHGRLLYHGLHGDDRLQRPMLRDAESGVLCPSTWTQAYQAIDAGLSALGEARKIVLVASPHASVEELHAFASLLGSAGGDLLGYRLMDSEMGEADELLLSADRTPNAEGARRLGMAEFDAASLDAVANENTVLFVLANDLAGLEEEAAAAVAKFGLVVHISPRVDATARLAHITLAAHDFAEREGLFVNGGGRVQHFEKAIDGPEDARDPLQVIADLGELLGHVAVWKTASDLRAELAARVDEFAAIAQGVGALGLALDDSAEGAEVKS
jgi:NADH-quinone oxidoreductase subunit G